MNAWVDNAQPNDSTRHLIDAAVFELSFGREMTEWASEPQLERIVETEFMTVVNEVFDELALINGVERIDSLEIDLGSVRFDGTWDGARERLRDLLRSALNDVRSSTDAGRDNGLRTRTAAPRAPSELDVLAYFLLYGMLPTGTRVRDGLSMETLLLTSIRTEPQQLADLIRRTSTGDVVASRLARQFSDSALEQVARGVSPGHADALMTLARGLRQVATTTGSGPVWQGEMRRALWSRLLTNLAAPSPPQIDLVVRGALEESARFLGLTFRELSYQLSRLIADSGEPGALIRRFVSDAAPLFSSIDDLVAGLEQGRSDAIGSALERLRSGDLPLAVLSGRLSAVGHRRLVAGILEASSQKTEETSELGKAVESYARRSGSVQTFYQRVIERLVSGEVIDLEAISAQRHVAQSEGAPTQSAKEHPDALGRDEAAQAKAVQEEGAAVESLRSGDAAHVKQRQVVPLRPAERRLVEGGSGNGAAVQAKTKQEKRATVATLRSDDAAHALGIYLRLGTRAPGVDRQHLMDVAEHLLMRAPYRASELLRQALSEADEAPITRLVELLPERLLTRALYLLAPAVHAQVRRYAEAVATASQGLKTGLGAVRIATLKWQFCFSYLLSTAGEVEEAVLEGGFAVYLASHASGLDAGELGNQLRERLGEIATSVSEGAEQAQRMRDSEAGRKDSERLFRGYDLRFRLAQHLGGEVAPAARGSVVLSPVIDEITQNHPDQLHRIFLELRDGVLEKSRVTRLSDDELRALVHAFLLLPPASAQAERSQLARSIDEQAERAGSAQAFYGQVLERLVDDELIDLEAIGSASRIGPHEGVPEPVAEQHDVAEKAPRGTAAQRLHEVSAEEDTGEAERALEAYLSTGTQGPDAGRQRLMDLAEYLLRQAPERATDLLRKSLRDDEALTRLVEMLPERLLARALYLLGPIVHARVQRYADVVASAFQRLETGLGSAHISTLKWQFCFRYLLSVGSKADLGELVHGLVDFLAVHAGKDARELRGDVGERLAAHNLQAAGDVGLQAARILAFENPGEVSAAPEIEAAYPPVPDTERDMEILEQGIRITNAGQVIAAPYLPRLFGMLDLLKEGSFKSPEAGERAVHLLQFMVDEGEDTAEYDLVLNKVLCGLDTATPVSRGIPVTADEKAGIEDLLGAMIQHWKALGNTSVEGLRESFLQREGTLRLKSSGWHLSVEPKAYDMLLDRIPWSFSTIKHSWMKEVLHVTWR